MTVVRPRRTGHPGYNLTLPRQPRTAAEARHLTRVSLSAWTLDDLADPAELVITEFVTNAVQHARGPSVRIIVERPADNQVYLGVVDRAPNDVPQQQEPDAEAAGGRGLMMVDALTDQWGYDRLGPATRFWGKRVWAVLAAKADT
ncbi:ATP-binding protein [Streptomyces sp. NBC_00893]|uniref:ATP-binding protein n=1 Tax=Streptomyces sp. NBC_00893 TaxID=2975862 RepID=UPI0022529231|nr:ATP-binding protein [Streptomyces sp. NBC_00893]MCX4851980.1 ATP-binding protein [Streptomyces sp. NBC_00893]